MAQEKEQQPLIEVLFILQERYEVQFNYAEDVVQNIKATLPESSLTLQQALQRLRAETQLQFTLINQEYVLINTIANQVFCGVLKEANTMLPLANATIQYEDSYAISDENGFFQMPYSSEDGLVKIQHLGYKTIKDTATNLMRSGCGDIIMYPDAQMLNEVVISGYIAQGIDKISNGSYQINFENFEILPGVIDADVLRSIQTFPGIQSVNETVSNINIRGGTHDQNLILWDNIKMYQSGHFFGLISMYNPEITHTVELIKNGTSSTLTDGISGTISMHTEDKINQDLKANIGLNLIDVNGFADVPLGTKSSLQIAARKSLSDLAQTPIYDEYFERIAQNTELDENTENVRNTNESFDFYDASLRWLYEIDANNRLQLNFINVSNDLTFTENATINNNEESRESSIEQNSIAAAITYSRQWHDKLKTSFEIYETDYKLRAVNANVLEQQRFLQENIVSETSAKLITDFNLNSKFSLQGGYHFVETQVTNLDDVDDPIFRLKVSEVVRTHAVFSQLRFRNANRTSNLNLGARINYIDKFQKTIVEPRLSFNQKLTPSLALEILGELKHQNTSQVINFQNDFLGIEKRRWQLSNDDDIPILTSQQASIGLHFEEDGWLLSMEGYFKSIDGLTTQSQGFQNQYEFLKEKGSSKSFGVDALIRKQYQAINAWLSYSYLDSEYEFESLEPDPFTSNFSIDHSLSAGINYVQDKIKLSLGVNWRSGKPITTPVEGNEIVDDEINFSSTNTDRLDDYLRVDASGVYTFTLGSSTRAELGVSVWNILNQNNQLNAFYRIKDDAVVEQIQESLGITPNVSFKVFL